ncbi:MAG: hypothetical protein AB7O45_10835 [Alphaproteobacteria bacterium]
MPHALAALILVFAALVPAARAGDIAAPRPGTSVAFAATDAGAVVETWTVTGVDGRDITVEVRGDDGSTRTMTIARGLFPARDGARTETFDGAALDRLRPLEQGRVAQFASEERGPEGIATWQVHVGVADRRMVETRAGEFDAIVIEHHRRGKDAAGRPIETLVEWSIATGIGLPVAMRAWAIANGKSQPIGRLIAKSVTRP